MPKAVIVGAVSGRIFLSPPSVSLADIAAVNRALQSGWIAPLGPEVDAFERELAEYVGVAFGVALSSGTAALHLALLNMGVSSGDEVVVPTLTFAATAFAATYAGAQCVFIDSEPLSWNLDPELLADCLRERERREVLPAAVICVDLFGRSCDYDAILAVAREFGIPVLADAAEALGATYGSRACGGLGQASVISFNGNKIITTSGGGMLLTNDPDLAARARYMASQARNSAPWYEHTEIGYNYRMSNILAALGRSQLARIDDEVQARKRIRASYQELLDFPGVEVVDDPPWGRSNAWLTVATFDGTMHPDAPTRIREQLEAENIESRPIWKPMHRQPVFAGAERYLNGVSDRLFNEALCLPSGSGLSRDQVERVCAIVSKVLLG